VKFRGGARLDVAVVITDTFGRVWRNGVTDVALGIGRASTILDLRGTTDANGRLLEATEVAIVDEVCVRANLVLGKGAGHAVRATTGTSTSPTSVRDPSPSTSCAARTTNLFR